jgi:hypothetical protein
MTAALAQNLIEDVEQKLGAIYRFPLQHSAVDFFMQEEQFVKEQRAEPSAPPRAAVFLVQKADEMEIGIYIEPKLFDILRKHDPKIELNSHNLDAYCVLVEEISHFHLLLQRSEQGRGVSQLELEWQGEVDKLLIAGLLMSEQKRKSCFQDLHRSIFEEAQLSADPVYQEASHYAAKCWHRLLPKCGRLREIPKEILPVFHKAYHSNWNQKLRLIHSL